MSLIKDYLSNEELDRKRLRKVIVNTIKSFLDDPKRAVRKYARETLNQVLME